MYKTSLGATHPDTLVSMNNLASLFGNQGKYEEAEALYVSCFEMRKTVLGAIHPDTLVTMSNLAGLYESQGMYEDAFSITLL